MKIILNCALALLATTALGAAAWAQNTAGGGQPTAASAPGAEQKFDFAGAKVPAAWQLTGEVTIDAEKTHGGGPGGALKLAPGSSAVLKVADEDQVGKVEFWVYEDGGKPADPKALRDGPVVGIKAADNATAAVGPIYAPYLDGGSTYAIGVSPDGQFLYRSVIYLGIRRTVGWHKWTFLFDNAKGWTLLCDDKDVNAGGPKIIQENVKARGFAAVVIAGDTVQDGGQTLWVDDVTVSPAGPLTSTGVPESQIMPATKVPEGGYYAAWKNGPPKDSQWFPLAVWCQSPANAEKYKAIGINTYVALWDGPTEAQLAALKKVGMYAVCEQNAVGLRHVDDPTIIGWMHGDEPDNAQSDGKGGYGPPIKPETILAGYEKVKAADPTRPVLLNLGCGVAWDNWIGRGVRTNKPEDYPLYIKGCDIPSFDIYPVTTANGEVQGKLWKVPFGLDRLVGWGEGKKATWNALECTPMGGPELKPTPHQVKAEVWMSLIHGSRGLVYFAHYFKPTVVEAGLLEDREMTAAVGKINRQILELAPLLNGPNTGEGSTIASSNKYCPVDAMIKQQGGATYVFAVAMRDKSTKATFVVKGLAGKLQAEVLGEGRIVDVPEGKFTDDFQGYGVHLYKIVGK